jgi:phospholipase C
MDPVEHVKTIVIVMLENRSFDHLLGWMSLKPYGNRTDIEGLKGPIDGSMELTDPAYRNFQGRSTWRPFIAADDVPLPSDLPHGRRGVQIQMHKVTPGLLRDPHTGEKYTGEGFMMDGFAMAHFAEHKVPAGQRPASMMIMPPSLIPATSFLARNFMVCDHWFSPIPTDTHPNRLMSLCGYTNIDETGGDEPIPLPDHDSILDWCEAQNVRWRVYGDRFTFVTFMTLGRPGSLEGDPEHFRNLSALLHDFQSEKDGTFPQLIIVEPVYSDDPGAQDETMGIPHPILYDPNDNHPPNPMGPGEEFLAQVYLAVTSNPERWKRTVMILLYDEHGGFFDHVPPFPVTTPAMEAWKNPQPFFTSGPRVPAIIVSPLVPQGSVSHLRFDHTSILQFATDVWVPGSNFYSQFVKDRFLEGKINSVSEALRKGLGLHMRFPPQEGAPKMPTVKFTGPRRAEAARVMTPGMKAFADARRILAPSRAEAVAALSRQPLPQVRLGNRNYIAARHIEGSKLT